MRIGSGHLPGTITTVILRSLGKFLYQLTKKKSQCCQKFYKVCSAAALTNSPCRVIYDCNFIYIYQIIWGRMLNIVVLICQYLLEARNFVKKNWLN